MADQHINVYFKHNKICSKCNNSTNDILNWSTKTKMKVGE